MKGEKNAVVPENIKMLQRLQIMTSMKLQNIKMLARNNNLSINNVKGQESLLKRELNI